MLCIEIKQTRSGCQTIRSSIMELFGTMQCQELILYWQTNSNLNDVEIAELSMFAIIFCFHDKIESMEEDKNPEDLRTLNSGSFFHFRCDKYNLLLPLLRNSFSLTDPIVFSRFYKMVFESKPYFGNILINCKDVQRPEICHFEIWNLCSHQFWFKKLHFQQPK